MNILTTIKENPALVGGGVFVLFLLTRLGGSTPSTSVNADQVLASQRIAGDINLGLAAAQVERERVYADMAEVSAARDVGIYQTMVQAYMGNNAFNAAVAEASYNYMGINRQAQMGERIAQIQGDVAQSEIRSNLIGTIGAIGMQSQANVLSAQIQRQALNNELSLGTAAIDMQKSLGFRQLQSADYATSVQGQTDRLAIAASRDVAFKSLDLAGLTSERAYNVEMRNLDMLPAIMRHEGNIASLQGNLMLSQMLSDERIHAATMETQQYISKKLSKTSLLNNLMGSIAGIANTAIGMGRL